MIGFGTKIYQRPRAARAPGGRQSSNANRRNARIFTPKYRTTDLNYIGSLDPEVMKKDREQIGKLLGAICKSVKLDLAKLPDEYASRKYTASYHSYFSGRGNIQVDINYLHRVSYWPPQLMNSSKIDSLVAKDVPIISTYSDSSLIPTTITI